jgi:hypothetical protein
MRSSDNLVRFSIPENKELAVQNTNNMENSIVMRWILNWMIGIIDTLYTVLGTAGNYSAIADVHTLPFTATLSLVFSAFTSRILVTEL